MFCKIQLLSSYLLSPIPPVSVAHANIRMGRQNCAARELHVEGLIMARFCVCLIGIISFCTAGLANASETVTYTYDAKGRLVKVVHAGTTNNGVVVQYAHDHADNRTNVKVTGAP